MSGDRVRVVTAAPLDAYLAERDAAWAPLTRELDRLILAAAPALVARVAYRMLVYSLGTDKARWVVAIDVRPAAVVVRFLWGTLLDDPRGILRGGTSTLMNVDLASSDALEPTVISDFVAQAVARYPAYLALSAKP